MRPISSALLLASFAVLSACNKGDDQAERGVDTTLPDNPGKLTGSLSFPSEGLPADLRVCAEAVDGGKQFCNSEISGDAYSLSVPAGKYRVFAQTAAMKGVKAYYSDFVDCGYNSWCNSHAPIEVAIDEGQTRTGINPGDWYAQQAGALSGDTSIAENATSPSMSDNTGGNSDGEGDDSADAMPADTQTSDEPRSLVGSLAGLFTTDDYPPSAADNNEQGEVGIRLTIGPNGRVTNCEVISSSGSATLDQATCRIASARARFSGPGTYRGSVSWRLE